MFDEFYAKLKDIVTQFLILGKPEPKIVRKVLRTLPKRFLPRSLPLRN